jgi:single-stranded-DNA-specific exonuclease
MEKKKIYIFSDSDVDGISALAVMASILKDLLPESYLTLDMSSREDTYGLSGDVEKRILNNNPDLLIALDCGTSNAAEISNFKKNHIDVIVIDHHSIAEEKPDAYVINPRLENSKFPNDEISTVGLTCLFLLAFYLRHTKFYETPYYFINERSCSEDDTELQNPQSLVFTELCDIKKGTLYFQGVKLLELSYTDSCDYITTKKISKIKPIIVYYDSEINIKELTDDNLFSLKLLYKDIEQNKEMVFESEEILKFLQISEKSPEQNQRVFFYYNIFSRPSLFKRFFESLDMAAIGSITDMVPLKGENRIFVKAGMESLRNTSRPGLKVLLNKLKIESQDLNTNHIGWDIGPNLNAPGRLGKPHLSKELLLAEDYDYAELVANKIININEERKEITKENQEKVLYELQDSPIINNDTIIYFHNELKPGVTGLVASRISEKYKKVVTLLGPENDLIKGSIRSCIPINVMRLINPLKDYLIEFGGHPRAAGFTLEEKKLDEFLSEWVRLYSNLESGTKDEEPDELIRPIKINLNQVDIHFYKELLFLEPFGMGNPEPLFYIENIIPQSFRFMGKDSIHAKFQANGKRGIPIDFVIWQRAKELSEYINNYSTISVSGILRMNIYNSRRTLQFIIDQFNF